LLAKSWAGTIGENDARLQVLRARNRKISALTNAIETTLTMTNRIKPCHGSVVIVKLDVVEVSPLEFVETYCPGTRIVMNPFSSEFGRKRKIPATAASQNETTAIDEVK
jgi:hypothetical protein